MWSISSNSNINSKHSQTKWKVTHSVSVIACIIWFLFLIQSLFRIKLLELFLFVCVCVHFLVLIPIFDSLFFSFFLRSAYFMELTQTNQRKNVHFFSFTRNSNSHSLRCQKQTKSGKHRQLMLGALFHISERRVFFSLSTKEQKKKSTST